METYQNFKNEWLGRRIDYDHVYGYQCVDLILEFMKECAHVASGISGNAIDYATKPSPAFLNATVRVKDASKQPGDILIFRGITDPNGHAAIRDTDVNKMLEQNGFDGNGSGLGKDAIGVYRAIPYDRLVTTYRLKNFIVAPTPPAPPAPTPAVNNGPNYDGNSITIQAGWGLSNAAQAAGWPDAGSPVRWAAIASFNGSNDWQTFNAELKPGQRIVVGKYTPPAAPPVKPQANIVFSKITSPLNLVTNKQPTHVWQLDFPDDAHATSVQTIEQGRTFVAFGKAQRTDHDKPCYYMTEADFGNADTTSVPLNNRGVNVVDLSYPAAQHQEPNFAESIPNVEDTGEAVDVKVLTNAEPATKFQYTSFLSPQDFTVVRHVEHITELQRLQNADGSPVYPDQELLPSQPIKVAGKMFDPTTNNEYYRTIKSVVNNTFYPIPMDAVQRKDDISNEEMDELLKDVGSIWTSQAGDLKAKSPKPNLLSKLLQRNKH